jgi:hypothetical protein
MLDVLIIASYFSIESIYYYFYKDRVTYPVYRINNKDIIIGTCHPNHITSIDKEVKNYIDECDITCVEGYSPHLENNKELVKSILDNINNSNSNKVLNYLIAAKIDFKLEDSISNRLFYKKSFLDRLKVCNLTETKTKTIFNILESHDGIINVLYGMDHIIAMQSLNNNKKVIKLDEIVNVSATKALLVDNVQTPISDAKAIIITTESSIIYKLIMLCQRIKFIFNYIFSFPNFADWYNSRETNFMFHYMLSFNIFNNNKSDLVAGRNKVWLETINPLIKTEDKILIAVGASHIKGLINELKQNNIIEKYNYWNNLFEQI